MILSDIKAAIQRRKFRPFDLVMNDGSVLVVEHPENVFFATEETIVIVTYHEERTKKRINIIDLDQVNRVSLELQPA
jgi:hypothetical protein